MSQKKLPIGSTSPAIGGFKIIPSNSEFTDYTRGIYVGGAGGLTAVLEDDSEVTFSGLAAGSILPIRAKKILAVASGSPTVTTTATNLIGIF